MNSEYEKEAVITNDPEFISPKIDYAFKQMINSDELVSLENDDERRQIYKIREKAIMDYKVQNRAAREEGIREGIKEGIKEGKKALKRVN